MSLHDSSTSFGDIDGPMNPLTIDDAYQIGLRDGRASRETSATKGRDPLVVAKTLHQRHCEACHGADLSCIRIEEEFLPQVKMVLDASGPSSAAATA